MIPSAVGDVTMTASRLIVGAIVVSWIMLFAWLCGLAVAHVHIERRQRRRAAERAAVERRVADDFYRWEREYIAWRRAVSDGRPPSQRAES